MGCKSDRVLGQQTEFEFFQELVDNSETIMCGGAVTPIGFTAYSIERLKDAFLHLECRPEYLDMYASEVLDSGNKAIKMCVKHWLLHARAIGMAGERAHEEDWLTLAGNILGVVCLTNKWDYKEIINYYSTVNNILEG